MGDVEEMMCFVWVVLQKGHSGDGCEFASTLYNLFVLSVAGKCLFRTEMCGGGVSSILLFTLVASFLDIIYVCIWRIFAFMCVVVT